MSDRYLRIVLTIIAVELGWLGLKDVGPTAVSAQAPASSHARRHHRRRSADAHAVPAGGDHGERAGGCVAVVGKSRSAAGGTGDSTAAGGRWRPGVAGGRRRHDHRTDRGADQGGHVTTTGRARRGADVGEAGNINRSNRSNRSGRSNRSRGSKRSRGSSRSRANQRFERIERLERVEPVERRAATSRAC